MKVSFEGIGETVVTFCNDSTKEASAGGTVKMSGSGEVCACSDGDRFAGVAVSAGDDFAAVQMGGYIKIAYTGTAPDVGYVNLVSDGSGSVKTGSSGGEYLVVDVDTAGGKVGFIL